MKNHASAVRYLIANTSISSKHPVNTPIGTVPNYSILPLVLRVAIVISPVIQDLGQVDDIAGKPNNDDEEDYLVETVPIFPNTYILDTTATRGTCSGNMSFSGDGTADSVAGSSPAFG